MTNVNPERTQRTQVDGSAVDLSRESLTQETSLPVAPSGAAPGIARYSSLLTDESDTVRVSYAAALASRPGGLEKALPDIRTALLTDPNRDVVVSLLEAVGDPSLRCRPNELVPALTYLLADESDLVRRKAIERLSEMGRAASGALPALYSIYEMEKRDTRRVVRAAIDKIDPVAFDRLTDFIDSLDAQTSARKEDALEKLLHSKALPFEALRAAVQTMHMDESTAVMERAAAVVAAHAGRLSAYEKTAILPSLMIALKLSEDYEPFVPVKQHALTALAKIGSEARSAIPVLEGMIYDALPEIRPYAVRALTAIDPRYADQGMRCVVRDSSSASAWLREESCKMIAHLSSRCGERAAVTGLAALEKLVLDREPSVREQAVLALGRTTRFAAEALGALTDVINRDSDHHVKAAACRSIAFISPSLGASELSLAAKLLEFAETDPVPSVAEEARAARAEISPLLDPR